MMNSAESSIESRIKELIGTKSLPEKKIFFFGHCDATEKAIDLCKKNGLIVSGILDNSSEKNGKDYNKIPIMFPLDFLKKNEKHTIVLVCSRFFESMKNQLLSLGYSGEVVELISYNSFSEYSLSDTSIKKMVFRLERGKILYDQNVSKEEGHFYIFFPFDALGDICFGMSYLSAFLHKRGVVQERCVIFVLNERCRQVVGIYSDISCTILEQVKMDELLQAFIYSNLHNFFIAHQDRPYIVKLHSALKIKCIPLDIIYRCGIYGLPFNTAAERPTNVRRYSGLDSIPYKKSVILSPYAKSVIRIPNDFWVDRVKYYKNKGFSVYTNVAKNEEPLQGTTGISPRIDEMQSVVEYAGVFEGIRSGICDVIRYAECEKIAYFPDYHYSDTRWKAVDMYRLEGWKNIVVDC